MSGIWVCIEAGNGELRGVAYEMINAARTLADDAGQQVSALVWGEGAKDNADKLGACGADSVVVIETAGDEAGRPAEVGGAVALLAQEQSPSVVLFADGAFARSVAPALAQKLNAAYVGDVVDVAFDGAPVFTRLPYSGKVIEQVRPASGAATAIATIRPKAFEAVPPASARSPQPLKRPPACSATSSVPSPSASIFPKRISSFRAAAA